MPPAEHWLLSGARALSQCGPACWVGKWWNATALTLEQCLTFD